MRAFLINVELCRKSRHLREGETIRAARTCWKLQAALLCQPVPARASQRSLEWKYEDWRNIDIEFVQRYAHSK